MLKEIQGRWGHGRKRPLKPLNMIKSVTRSMFVMAGLIGGYAATQLVDWQNDIGLPRYYVIFLLIILGGSIGFVFGGIAGREISGIWQQAEDRLRDMSPMDLLLSTAGLVAGLIIAVLASFPLRLMQPQWLALVVTLLLLAIGAYGGVSAALIKRRDLAAIFPLLASSEYRPAEERLLILDTSAVIDGRFVELSRLGFLPGMLRVPRFVLAELQTLADSADEVKRARGRRGLDLLSALPDDDPVEVFETDYPEIAAVDDKLMRLAVDTSAALVSVDYNLAKVARLRDVEVLNINEAAMVLRPAYLPGELIRIKVVRQGKEPDQGVGYLDDGTMVVVQKGRDLIGAEHDVEVTSVLQTSAGRMIFARPTQDAGAVAH